jgi:hypothetical protein
MLKKLLLTILLLLLAGAAVYGTWYYMDMQVTAAKDETTAVNGQLTTTKAELLTAQNELKVKADAEAALVANLTTLDGLQTLAASSGSGQVSATGQLVGTGIQSSTGQLGVLLNTLYDTGLIVEGRVSAESLREYSFELQKLAQGSTPAAPVVAQPIKLAQGEWTAVVQVRETPVEKTATVKTVSTLTGSLLKEKLTPLLPQRELVVVLAKWANGKIVEQYEFPYAGEANESKILEYIKK